MAKAKTEPKKIADKRNRMARLTAALQTKAARIRALAAAGYKRQEIADFLGTSYHRVRNVLRQPVAGHYPQPGAASRAGRTGFAEEAADVLTDDVAMIDGDPPIVNFRVDRKGRIRLPSEVMSALDTAPGQWIPASFENGELCLLSADAAFRRVRQWNRRPVPKGRDSVDQFIVEKRREALLEDARDRKWLRSS